VARMTTFMAVVVGLVGWLCRGFDDVVGLVVREECVAYFVVYARDGRARALYCTASLDLPWISAHQLALLLTAFLLPHIKFCLSSCIPRTLQMDVSEVTVTVPVANLHPHIWQAVQVQAYQSAF
jgi:hypothetical protein